VHREVWWKFRVHGKQNVDDEQGRRRLFLATIAYPVSYAILVAPLSIVRWLQNAGSYQELISSADSLAVGAVFGLSGIVNVVLFLLIRPNLLLFGKESIEPRSGIVEIPPSPPSLKSSQPRDSVELETIGAETHVELARPSLPDNHGHAGGM